MKRDWQLQDAKNQLSRVVVDAKEHGPQTITVHGRPAAVVLSVEEFRRLAWRRRKNRSRSFFATWRRREPGSNSNSNSNSNVHALCARGTGKSCRASRGAGAR